MKGRFSRIGGVALGMGAVVLSVWAVGAVSRGQEPAGVAAQARTLPAPVVDTHHLMELFNQPFYRKLKQGVQNEPSGEKQWKLINETGLQLAEVANLIVLREQAEGQEEQWNARAADVQQSAIQVAQSAEQRDYPQTRAAYQRLVQNCNACHQTLGGEHAPQLKP